MAAKFVTDYLEKTAEKWPERVAVTDEAGQMTFGQMQTEMTAVGAALAASGLSSSPVMLWMGRDARSIAAAQGVALSGRPYAPVDISLPKRRLRYMIEVLQPSAVIAAKDQAAEAEALILTVPLESKPKLLVYEDMIAGRIEKESVNALRSAAERRLPTDPVCILFTSGSTGKPKGVAVSHELICRQIEDSTEIFGLDETQVRAGQVPLYFTMAAYDDVYSVLATGGRLLLLSAAQIMFPKKLMRLMRQQGVNTLFWVPSMMRLAVDAGALELPPEELPELRFVSFAGEPMPPATLASWRGRFPDAAFVNRFGATELGLVTYAFMGAEQQVIPMGKCVSGQDILLLDDHDRKVEAPGEMGEICMRGLMALGYWRERELTERAFTRNPLQEAYPERMYRTGDLAYFSEDGELIYVSRRDDQIKHRGYRIELGDIETAAAEIPGIRAACVYDRNRDEIVLFYAGNVRPKALLAELSPLLPRYMWPARLEQIEELPYTGSGKIDRQILKSKL